MSRKPRKNIPLCGRKSKDRLDFTSRRCRVGTDRQRRCSCSTEWCRSFRFWWFGFYSLCEGSSENRVVRRTSTKKTEGIWVWASEETINSAEGELASERVGTIHNLYSFLRVDRLLSYDRNQEDPGTPLSLAVGSAQTRIASTLWVRSRGHNFSKKGNI